MQANSFNDTGGHDRIELGIRVHRRTTDFSTSRCRRRKSIAPRTPTHRNSEVQCNKHLVPSWKIVIASAVRTSLFNDATRTRTGFRSRVSIFTQKMGEILPRADAEQVSTVERKSKKRLLTAGHKGHMKRTSSDMCGAHGNSGAVAHAATCTSSLQNNQLCLTIDYRNGDVKRSPRATGAVQQ